MQRYWNYYENSHYVDIISQRHECDQKVLINDALSATFAQFTIDKM